MGSASDCDAQQVHFNRDIRPILAEKCFHCHGPDSRTREADLRLDTREGLLGDGQGLSVVHPGKVDLSELYQRLITSEPDEQMPPVESEITLAPNEVKLIKKWIEQGAQWEGHWSFLPIQDIPVPAITEMPAGSNEIDAFLLERLKKEGLGYADEADPVTLIRRLSFDLLGLPPDQELIEKYRKDRTLITYESIVEELLASSHFGERLAMYWLDLVRYGDSIGYHSDNPQQISPYRDYVIQAFNSNMPFDQFTREQLAGDLLESPTQNQIIATGYNRLNKMTAEGGAQPQEYLEKYAADRVRTTTGAWLGITMGCAECHDHKYDPFTMKDFYSFAAYFADIEEVGHYSTKGQPPSLEIKSDAPKVPTRNTLITVSVEPREMRILPRGNWLDRTGPVVTSAAPEAILPKQFPQSVRRSRLELADWIMAPNNPLTSRVFVNRLWKLYFGHGLSRTLDDLGAQGEWPTHPELLDYLAYRFQSEGWNVKAMIKAVVMSRAYRQTSVASEKMLKRDPENKLFARQSRWRHEAEVIRDNALATSGLLVTSIGGESFKPYQPKGYWQHLNFPKRTWEHATDQNQYRRGLYIHWQRTFLHPSLLAFDAPSREECTAMRPISNTPKAALTLLNDPSFVEAARVFAVSALKQEALTPDERIDWIWQVALSRKTTSQEQKVVKQLYLSNKAHFEAHPEEAANLMRVGMSEVPDDLTAPEIAAWTAVTRTVMNLHEFITRN